MKNFWNQKSEKTTGEIPERSVVSSDFAQFRRRFSKTLCSETIILWLVPAALFLGVFWRSFDGDSRFSYRDVAYFYYPLFEQIQNEWNSGRLPLWDPFENLGQPLAGNPSTAVFYPGKAIFFLSSAGLIDFATCFKIYIYAHFFFAFFGIYFLTRRLKISRAGATFAGISFAFSGQILFQYSNIIYLVGAAWLPFVLLFAFDFFAETSLKRKLLSALKLSVVDALAILGGEPQIVYLTTIAIGFFIFFAPARLVEGTTATFSVGKRSRLFLGGLFLGGVATTAASLAAIQILPSLEMIKRSERSAGDVPRSLWEIPGAFFRSKTNDEPTTNDEFYSGLLCRDVENRGQSRSTYRFSVGPWRWAEFLFPNVGGRQFPQAGRWFSIFPEEIAVWTPTLYFGVVPFLLAALALRFRRRKDRDSQTTTNAQRSIIQAFRRWTSWLAAIATFATLGGYGVVWAFRFFRAALGDEPFSSTFQNGDPIGGVYWFFNLTLPKFVEFRYPAKLLTLSAAAFSVLAGFGWDEEKFSRKFRATSGGVFAIAVAGFLFVSIRGDSLFSTIRTVDPLYGPFQPRLAFQTIRAAFGQTALVLALTSTLLIIWEKALKINTGNHLNNIKISTICSLALLATTAFDVGLANSWSITTASRRLFEPRGDFLQMIKKERVAINSKLKEDFAPKTDAAPPIRVYRFPVWFPPTFQQKTSADRTTERVVWDELTLFPKYPFFNGIATIDARGTATETEYAAFVDALPNRTKIDADAAFLDVSYLLGPPEITSRLSPPKDGAPTNKTDANAVKSSVSLKKIDATPKRVWIFRSGQPVQAPKERAEIVAFEPNRIVYFLETQRPAEVVFSEQYWPNWTATAFPISTAQEKKELLDARFNANATRTFCQKKKECAIEIPVEKTFRFLRKISIDAGSYCVVLTYRPRHFYLGATISGFSWTIAAILFATVFIQRNRSRRRKS